MAHETVLNDVGAGNERADLLRQALTAKIIAIVRVRVSSPLVRVADALIRGGIRSLEFTMTTPGALEAVEECRRQFDREVVIGAGTVLTVDEVRRCLEAGAEFIVSPGTDSEVIHATRQGGALSMPGAMTPTEILAAWRAGADAVKVFPARSMGPRYIADVLAPLHHIPLIPTGGVDASNAAAYLAAGAVAVGVGGNLVSEKSIVAEDWAALEERAREIVEAVRGRG